MLWFTAGPNPLIPSRSQSKRHHALARARGRKFLSVSGNGHCHLRLRADTGRPPAGKVVQYRVDGGAWKTNTKSITISANGVHKERSTTVSISAEITPALKAPNKAKPGEYVNFNVTGFDRYDTVTLKLGGTTLGTVLTDVEGAAKVTLHLPITTPVGAATVAAGGSDGDPTATIQLTMKK